jgi:lysozyme family protein
MTYPSLDIENLTLDQARAIYLRDFWNKFGGDNLAPELAFQVFDGAVNSGVCRSILWLQEAVGAVADGVFGPATLAAVATRDPLRVIAAFNGYRLKFMKDTKTWPTYSRGWTDRIAENLIAVGGGE